LDAHAELLISELKATGSVQLAGIGKLKLGQRAELFFCNCVKYFPIIPQFLMGV
jgi:hypothetical protein